MFSNIQIIYQHDEYKHNKKVYHSNVPSLWTVNMSPLWILGNLCCCNMIKEEEGGTDELNVPLSS